MGATGTRVCVVGPDAHFLSGITYYTYELAGALGAELPTSVIFMRRLIPARLYPGGSRVGADLARLRLPEDVRAFRGVDWFAVPSLARALAFLRRERPDVVVFQWWTGAVLHSYLALAVAARRLGARIVVEFHETQDVGEAEVPLVRPYVSAMAPRFFRMASDYVVHSEFDRNLVVERFALPAGSMHVVPHGVYDHYRAGGTPWRDAPAGVANLLYFGVIRPFKGVEDLIAAFEAMPDEEAAGYWLTIVGETWEGHTLPAELIARSPRRERITFVNRYVTDEEADRLFAGADVVVLPYHRSSQSGPLHMAFAYGVPVVVSRVGGLVEAASGYAGAELVEPRDPASILDGIRRARARVGERFEHPSSWRSVGQRYADIVRAVAAR